ncbi:cellulase family glycosylhydrolase [Acidimangrovimonas pyrenivorans]|uniref:Cellulase family glycosylhydrolase n=1 Tax=Acidimangrovimonas pyrenivorans TaxID=2030798 RepID=A0ABV7AGF9_9RHOB
MRALSLGILAVIAATAFVGQAWLRAAPAEAPPPGEAALRAATAACTRTRARIPGGVLGISDPHADDPGVIDLIAATGVHWVRAEFYWRKIEPVPGAGYHWAHYDAMVKAYARRGIRIQAILTYMPDSLPPDWSQRAAAFERFTAAAVRRYAPLGVHLWEVFNEPNLPGYGWLTRGNDTRANLDGYVLMLAAANRAMRKNDPKAVVLIGGMASDQHRGLPVETTMARVYRLGARNCFDVMAFHPYGYQGRFGAARARIDALLEKAGDSDKPVWFNEYGWTEQKAMDMARNPGAAGNPMLRALEQRTVADAFFWFSAKDYSSRYGTPAFGLATYKLERRPSFYTFRHFVEGLRQ